MKNLFCIMLVLVFVSSQAISQNCASVVVVAVAGKAKYQSPNLEKSITLNPGAVISMDGSIELDEGVKVTCLCDDKFVNIQGRGMKSIRKAVTNAKPKPVVNFDNTYSQFVQAAVNYTSTVAASDESGKMLDPKKRGDGWAVIGGAKGGDDGWAGIGGAKGGDDGWSGIGGAKGGDDGWSDQSASAIPYFPFGKVISGLTRFRWKPIPGVKQYTLEIMDPQGNVIHSLQSKRTDIDIDLATIDVKTDQLYQWRVYDVTAEPEAASNKLAFAVATKKELEEAARKALKSNLGPGSNPGLKSMMEAAALEQASFYSAAAERYEMALEDESDNQMIRMSYAAFLKRFKKNDLAEAVLNSK